MLRSNGNDELINPRNTSPSSFDKNAHEYEVTRKNYRGSLFLTRNTKATKSPKININLKPRHRVRFADDDAAIRRSSDTDAGTFSAHKPLCTIHTVERHAKVHSPNMFCTHQELKEYRDSAKVVFLSFAKNETHHIKRLTDYHWQSSSFALLRRRRTSSSGAKEMTLAPSRNQAQQASLVQETLDFIASSEDYGGIRAMIHHLSPCLRSARRQSNRSLLKFQELLKKKSYPPVMISERLADYSQRLSAHSKELARRLARCDEMQAKKTSVF